MKEARFELCAESLAAVRAAMAGEAHRIELCANLAVGGLTLERETMRAAIVECSIPIHVLIRPRAGGFVYTDDEFERMRQEFVAAKQAGAAGVAMGILLPDGRVDTVRTADLVALANPMRVTFHRAIDVTRDLSEALEAVIASGADCVLTSGGARDAEAGAERIALLGRQAKGRIEMMAGGGVRITNLLKVLRCAEVRMLHGSLLRCPAGPTWEEDPQPPAGEGELHIEDFREAMRLLREESKSGAES